MVLKTINLIIIMNIFSNCNWFAKGIKIELNNFNSTTISNIVVTYSGGNKSLSDLGVGKSHTFIVNPNGDSGLTLEYIDQTGNKIERKIDVYFGKNYSGKITINIEQNNKIEIKDNSHS